MRLKRHKPHRCRLYGAKGKPKNEDPIRKG